jgi:hypothetical protein
MCAYKFNRKLHKFSWCRCYILLYFFIYIHFFIHLHLLHIDTIFSLCYEVCWDKFGVCDMGESFPFRPLPNTRYLYMCMYVNFLFLNSLPVFSFPFACVNPNNKCDCLLPPSRFMRVLRWPISLCRTRTGCFLWRAGDVRSLVVMLADRLFFGGALQMA